MSPKSCHVALVIASTVSGGCAFQGATPGATASSMLEGGIFSLEHARRISDGFNPRVYRAPWWARDPHFSTIIGSGEVQKKLYGNGGPKVTYRRERWGTPDNDFLDIDFLDQGQGGMGLGTGGSPGAGRRMGGGPGAVHAEATPVAVLTHGLESTSTAPLTSKMALAFQRAGFQVAVVCFRGCSGEDNKTLGAYHLGFTDDLELVVRTLRERHPGSPIFLSGFSLGGNVICKLLADLGEEAGKLGVVGAAVTCVPFDAVSCQQRVDSGFGKIVYASNFLKSLLPKMQRKAVTNPELAEIVDLDRVQKATTIGEFDDAVIAPIYGFKDFQDYYRKTQSGPRLSEVRVPLLAVQARNDPFMDETKLPREKSLKGAPVRLAYYQHGGHCAFITHDRAENERGWLAVELARFGSHVTNMAEMSSLRQRGGVGGGGGGSR